MSKCPKTILIVGITLLSLTIVTWLLFPSFLNSKIEEQLQLRNGSDTYEKWRNITIPIYIKFYFFNVTNPQEVIRGQKPDLKEIGPFVYQETRLKNIENIDLEEDTLTYRQAINYFFRPDLSSGSEETQLTVLNIPLASVAKQATEPGFKGTFVAGIVNEFFQKTKDPSDKSIFIQRTVGQMIFGGYKVPLLQHLGELSGEQLLPNHTFGLYYGKNGTFGTEFTVLSGRGGSSQFGKIKSWEGKTELNWWNNDQYCNQINGSDGSVFSPFITRDSVLQIFSEDFCRSSYMTYQKDVEYMDLLGYRFTMPKSSWESGDVNAENACFCHIVSPDERHCNRNGTFSLSACRKGAPVVASTPYFLHGNLEDQEMYNLTPDPEAHETFIDIEPTSGMVLQARKMFQVNIELKPTKRVTGFKKIPELLLPIVWGEEYATTTPERAADLRFKLYTVVKTVNYVKWVLLIVGSSLAMYGLILLVKSKSSAKATFK